MCVGPELALALTAASTAASVAGNYMQTKANNASTQAQVNAKNAALQEGLTQQKQNQDQATGVLNNTLQKFSAPNQQQDLGSLVTNRTNTIAGNMTPAAAPDTNLKEAPQVVQSDLANRMAKVAGYGAQQANALAKVGATGDQFNNNALTLGDSGLKLGTISNFAQGQLGVNKLKQSVDANNARKSPNGLGDILSKIGTAGTIAGLGAGAGTGLSNLFAAGPSTGLGDAIYGVSTAPATSGISAGSTPFMV